MLIRRLKTQETAPNASFNACSVSVVCSWADAPRLPNALDPLGAFLASPVSGEEKSRRLSARLPVCSLPRPARRQTLS
ncbi:unnamed protein product [Gadus morhua 'NCC']